MATSEMAWKLFAWRDLGLRAAETPSEGRAAPGFADRGAALAVEAGARVSMLFV